MKGTIKHSREIIDFESQKVKSREEVREFTQARVQKIGKLHKGKRAVQMQQKQENIEGRFMFEAMKANRADKQRNDRRAKRRK